MEGEFTVTVWAKKTSNEQGTLQLEQNDDHTEYITEKHVTSECIPSVDLSDPKQLADFKQYRDIILPKKQQTRSGSSCKGKQMQSHNILGNPNLVSSPTCDTGVSGRFVNEDRPIGMFLTILLHIPFLIIKLNSIDLNLAKTF